MAKSQSVQVVAEISEKISVIQELLRLSRRGAIQKVLVCEASRLDRSTVEVLQVVDELTELGVSIYPGRRAVQNFGRCAVAIETLKNGKHNPVAQFLFTLLAEFARLERETLRERILSGMDESERRSDSTARKENWSPGRNNGGESDFSKKICLGRAESAGWAKCAKNGRSAVR